MVRYGPAGLRDLPVELLHDIQLLALSESLPFVSKRLHQVFRASSPLYFARYLFRRLSGAQCESEIYTKALRYPCCNLEVLDALRSLVERSRPQANDYPMDKNLEEGATNEEGKGAKKTKPKETQYFDLPRRLFKILEKRTGYTPWTETDAPLPYLRHLFDTFQDTLRPNPNANNGYALTKSVHIQSIPLVRYLLEHGASPETKDCIAIIVAIRQKNLPLVKLLIERQDQTPTKNSSKKRRRLEDRVKPDAKMLKIAVQCRARDITEYLCHEKGVVPDMQTLQMMM